MLCGVGGNNDLWLLGEKKRKKRRSLLPATYRHKQANKYEN